MQKKKTLVQSVTKIAKAIKDKISKSDKIKKPIINKSKDIKNIGSKNKKTSSEKNKKKIDKEKQLKKHRKEQIIIDTPEGTLDKYLNDPDFSEFKSSETNNKDIVDNIEIKKVSNNDISDFIDDQIDENELNDSQEIEEDQISDDIEDETEKQDKQIDKSESVSSPINGFFYTSDKFINSFEDKDICNYIEERYPNFNPDKSDDSLMKKTIVTMLNDVKFINELLEYYNMNIFDLFKFFYRIEPGIFKCQFVKRIQKVLKYKRYATCIKKSKFGKRKQVRKTKRRR